MNQPVLMGVYKSWIWIGIPLILASGVALWMLIPGVIALTKGSSLFRVPLREKQEIEFIEAGRVTLNMEGRRFTNRFAGVNFELYGAGGRRIPDSPSLLRKRSSGITDVRMELLSYDIPDPGRYLLVMTGLGSDEPDGGSEAIVFMKPHTAKTVAYAAGIAVASCIFIASMVILIMRLNKVGMGA
jgi:hypothetical protein